MMTRDIRVQTSKRYGQLFMDMTSILVGGDQHEVFFLCANIGFSQGRSTPLDRPEDRFWSGTITPDEWTCYYAMLLSGSNLDYDAIANDREVIRRVEQWAVGGLELLLDDFLGEYTNEIDGVLELDSSPEVRGTMPSSLLRYILDRTDEQVDTA